MSAPEIALQTPQIDLLPCHSYCYGTKRKAKDIIVTHKSVYRIKMKNGRKKCKKKNFLLSESFT